MDEQVRILCVDDEIPMLKTLKRLFMDTEYEILTASSGGEGLELLSSTQPIHVVVSDYRMPGMNGVEFLHEVCKRWPHTVRIVLSGYADTASIISAINEGEIYKFIPKPWDDDDLKVTIANAIERYFLYKKNLDLAERLREKNKELQTINENLETLVDRRTQELIFQNQALIKSQNILDSLPIALLGLDLKGIIVWYNKMGAAFFGESILGLDCHIALSPPVSAFIDRVIEKGSLTDRISIGSKADDGQRCDYET